MGRRLAVVVAVAAVAVAASSADAATGGSRSVCGGVGGVTGARVQRVHAGGRTFGVPGRIVVQQPRRAQLVARLLCGLPAFPHGVFSCPIDFPARYVMTLSGAGAVATLDPTGCQPVTGLATRRTAMRTPSFWSTFARDLGLGTKSLASFRGR